MMAYIIFCGVPNHYSLLGRYAPLLTNVQQGARIGLVWLELSTQSWPEGAQCEVLIMEMFDT